MNPDYGIKLQDRFYSGLSLLVIISTTYFHLKVIQFAYSRTALQHEIEHRKRRLLHKWRLYLQSTILI